MIGYSKEDTRWRLRHGGLMLVTVGFMGTVLWLGDWKLLMLCGVAFLLGRLYHAIGGFGWDELGERNEIKKEKGGRFWWI